MVTNHDRNRKSKKLKENSIEETPTQTRLPSRVAISVVREIYLMTWGNRVTNILWILLANI